MVKSIPLKNILSKKSLSSKKNVINRHSRFKDVLTKESIPGKKTTPSKELHKLATNKNNKQSIHANKDKNKNKTRQLNYIGIDNPHIIHRENKGKKKLDMQSKKQTNSHLTIKEKNILNLTDTRKTSLKDENTNQQKITINNKSQTSDIEKEKTHNKKFLIAETMKDRAEIKINKKTKTEKENHYNQQIDKMRLKTLTKKQTTDNKNLKVSSNKTDETNHTKTTMHKTSHLKQDAHDIHSNKTNIKTEDIKFLKIDTIRLGKADKLISIKNKQHNNDTNINYERIDLHKHKNTKIESQNKESEKHNKQGQSFSIKTNNIEHIKNKYSKKINIKKFVRLNKNDEIKNNKKVKFAIPNDKIKITQNKANIDLNGLNMKQANTHIPSIEVDVNILKKINGSIKIKTIKDTKNNKTIKIVESQTESKHNQKNITEIPLKKVSKMTRNVPKEILIEHRAETEQYIKSFKIPSDTKIANDFKNISVMLNKKDNKKYIVGNDDLTIQQTQMHIHTHNTTTLDNINKPYPMDKVIEHIDNMLNIKPPFNNTITIKLNPPHIGVLEIRVKMDKDKNISTIITADDKNVIKIVNSHIEGLKTYLNSQGIKVTHIDVHNGFHEQTNFGNNQNQGMYGGNQQHRSGDNQFHNFSSSFTNKETISFKRDYAHGKRTHIKGLDIIA